MRNKRVQKRLNDLASDCVGDGKTPLYFVTDGGDVVTVTTHGDIAYEHWRRLAARRPLTECALEDKSGVLASVEPDSDAPNAKLMVHDDYLSSVRR